MKAGIDFCEPDELREQLRMAMKIVEQSPVILFRRTPLPTPRLLYVSENIARFGYTADELVSGQVDWVDLVHPDDRDRLRDEVSSHAENGTRNYQQIYRIRTRDGDTRWVEDTTTTEHDADGRITHYQGIVVDVTERQEAEERLRKSETKFRRIVETAAEGFVLLDDDMRIVDVNDAYCRMLGYARHELIGKRPYDLATAEFRRFLDANIKRLLNRDYRVFEGMYTSKRGRRVPVLIHGNTLLDENGRRLGHVGFVTDLTEQKRSLMVAGDVQRNLMPQPPPRINGLDIAGNSVPCEEIGGDYYDFIEIRRDERNPLLAVAVGDISGHGVDSALLMATARAVFRNHIFTPGHLSDVVAGMNRTLLKDFGSLNRFMTLFAMEIDPVRGALQWVRAGHDPALVYRREQERFIELTGPGVPLGIFGNHTFAQNTFHELTAGTVIALGTDGIWEAHARSGEMFGKARFRKIIEHNAGQTAAAILEEVYREVYRFLGGTKTEDDITLVIVKIME
ncbi:MAG: SpoIIE family protein phosphatase [Desulfobacterales bacterium]|nr:SpoIIE family protein phosphatase [Desulfobacterales bacterium]